MTTSRIRQRRAVACTVLAAVAMWLVSAAFGSAEQAASAAAAATEAIIADHNHTDLSQIPDYWIDQAKASLRAVYGHTSHGSQLVSGMGVLRSEPSSGGRYDFTEDGAVVAGALSLDDRGVPGDLGNPNRYAWEAQTRTYLDDPSHSDVNVVVWSWCGQVNGTEAQINTYLSLMSGLEASYPDVTFVYMTGHLNCTGEGGNVNQRNNQIRSYVIANNGVLFDFADIESYDPDYEYFLDRGACDTCVYDSGNWATEWCAANGDDALCESCSCAHSEALNCNLKPRACWWMMARIAGWSGPGESLKSSSTITAVTGETVTYTVVLQNLSAPIASTIYLTDTLPSALGYVGGTLTATAGLWSDAGWPTLTWSGTLSPTPVVTITYAATVTTAAPLVVENAAEIFAPGHVTTTLTSTIIINPWQAYLPIVFRDYP